ncbi:hypothetical protein [Asticcacaulis solisilvae]|uniref:hypothetical protein n=1 Tax=Asticcacaulis solisilvae TaxID=1217274 RepID=UPI003FD8BFCA
MHRHSLHIMGFVAAVAVSAGPALARPHYAVHIERCYTADGVLNLSADAGFIFRAGHDISVATYGDWPGNVYRAMDKAQADTGSLEAWVRGTFTVCRLRETVPFKPWLHYAIIRSARHLRTDPEGPPH